MPEDVRAMTIKLILGLVTVFVWFLWLLAPMGICTQGSHVKSLCREPRFLFAINLNTLHSPQASVRLGESQKGAIHWGGFGSNVLAAKPRTVFACVGSSCLQAPSV